MNEITLEIIKTICTTITILYILSMIKTMAECVRLDKEAINNGILLKLEKEKKGPPPRPPFEKPRK